MRKRNKEWQRQDPQFDGNRLATGGGKSLGRRMVIIIVLSVAAMVALVMLFPYYRHRMPMVFTIGDYLRNTAYYLNPMCVMVMGFFVLSWVINYLKGI